MKRFKLLAIPAAAPVILALLAGCASMTVVSIDNESVTGPKQVRQYGVIDPKDIIIYAFYKDGSRKQLSVSKGDITFDGSKAGPQTVSVKTSKGSVSFKTEVMALTKITVTAQPKAWKLGVPARVPKSSKGGAPAAPGNDENNWPGLEIQAVWDQMGSEKISASAIKDECQFSGFDPNKAGSQSVTVAWKGKQTTFSIQVVGMESIKITSNPTKVTYYQGDTLDLTGLKVVGVWPGIGEETISVTSADVTGFNSANKGRQTITVTKSGRTTTFNVDVLDLIGVLNGIWADKSNLYEFKNGQFTNTVIGSTSKTYTFNNGAFTYTFTRAYTAGEQAGQTEQYRVNGTYAIAAGAGKPDTGVTTNGRWFGNVIFKVTGGDTNKVGLYDWAAFAIGTNPTFGFTKMNGTVLTVTTLSTPQQTSTYRFAYVKQ